LKTVVEKPSGGTTAQMSLKAKLIGPIPEDTRSIGQELLPESDFYRIIGDQYAELVKDEDFAALYSKTGQPAYSPARLSLVTVLQAMEHLSDRAARHMVRTRIDWKYALHLPLIDSGFDASVLCEFRQRLVEGKAERKFFDALLEKFKEKGLLKGRGLQRTDSLQIVAAVRDLNRLELVMETLRLALNSLVEEKAEWVKQNVPGSWIETYGEWIESERLVKNSGPQGKAETERLLAQTGRDGYRLMEQLESHPELSGLEAIKVLEKIWKQEYRRVESEKGAIEIEMSTKKSRRADGVDRERIVTPHDVEARYSEKRGQGHKGYKLHLTETAEEDGPALVTDVEVVGGQEYDGSALEGIHQRLEERGLLPEKHLADKGYVDGNTIVESGERGVELIGPIQEAPNSQASREPILASGQSVNPVEAGGDGDREISNEVSDPDTDGLVSSPVAAKEADQGSLNPGSANGSPGLPARPASREERQSDSGSPVSERAPGSGPVAASVIAGEDCLGLERFQFDFQGQTAICPIGVQSARWLKTIRRDAGPGRIGREACLIYWAKEKCVSCQLAPPSLIKQQRGRIVRVSPRYATIVERRVEQQSKEFKKKYRRRSGIEASLSTVVRGYGGRSTRYRGRAKTRAHYLRIASALNLRRAIAWEQGHKPERQRVVRMKKTLGLEKTTRQGWRQKAA